MTTKKENFPKTAIIRDCKIGKGTIIRDFTNVYKAKIGNNSKIGAYVYIEENVLIGNNVIIRPHSVITENTKIGDNVFIGQDVHMINDLYPNTKHIARVLPATIKKNAVIGTGSIIFPVVIGKNSFVAAGSIVTKNVPDYAIVAGSPAKIIGSTKDPEFIKKQKLRDLRKDPRIKSRKTKKDSKSDFNRFSQ
jgi:acetyltransferase-like isoleucine patch superfamily enzyme